jgi:pseudaminic acid cytidylyltransferase
MPNNLALIPARGGSKRIPGKNIKNFLGKPIISYVIETALESELFDEVMVSTDDEQIAGIGRAAGAEVPFMRSAENADDYATTADVIGEVLQEYEQMKNRSFDRVCCIYPTAVLTDTQALKDGYELLASSEADAVMPVVAFGYPVWRGLQINEDSDIAFKWPEMEEQRTQDLDKVYHDAGQWYWLAVDSFLHSKSLFHNAKAIVKNEMEVQDIDTLDDWELAKMKYRLKKSQHD